MSNMLLHNLKLMPFSEGGLSGLLEKASIAFGFKDRWESQPSYIGFKTIYRLICEGKVDQ